jgi:hypothetical protein
VRQVSREGAQIQQIKSILPLPRLDACATVEMQAKI